MKAIVATKYGSPDVLNLEEVEIPAPKDDEVLVKVRAASVNAGDWHLLRADPFLTRLAFGLLRPKHKILGADVAGRAEAVGENVTQFRPGDEVFGDLSGCGFGGFAEYVCAGEDALALKPANTSFEEAAAVPSAAATSGSLCNAHHLAVGLSAIALRHEIATNDSCPYMQILGNELRRMGQPVEKPPHALFRPRFGGGMWRLSSVFAAFSGSFGLPTGSTTTFSTGWGDRRSLSMSSPSG